MPRTTLLCTLALAFSLSSAPVGAQVPARRPAPAADRLTVVAWNVESGGAHPDSVARRIRSFQGVDLWGLSEVQNATWARTFENAAEDGEGADFARIVGASGGGDRLAILYDAKRFERLRDYELPEINIRGAVRAPLVAHLRDRDTGIELLFMVNHLYRGNEAGRHRQAALLAAWARSQRLPVIAVGDFNFDWAVRNGERGHDAGYDSLTAGGAFTWVRPARLVRSHCTPRYDTVLDFVFVTAPARAWPATSEILAVAGDCPDDDFMPDHRPVRAVFALRGTAAPPPAAAMTKAQLLERIEALEAEVRRLRAQVERLP